MCRARERLDNEAAKEKNNNEKDVQEEKEGILEAPAIFSWINLSAASFLEYRLRTYAIGVKIRLRGGGYGELWV